jgi:anti-sigma regulatory factor (Ser/Thr protein kinase)
VTAVKLAALVSGKPEPGEAVSGEEVAGPGVPGECAREFPGDLREVRAARRFVAGVLDGSPARDMLLICVSELAANAIEHTESGAGGVFTVTVGQSTGKQAGQSRGGTAFVAVTDEGGAGEPGIRRAGDMSEGGRGLALVDACSSRWGHRDSGRGRTVWAQVAWGGPPDPRSGPSGRGSVAVCGAVAHLGTSRGLGDSAGADVAR